MKATTIKMWKDDIEKQTKIHCDECYNNLWRVELKVEGYRHQLEEYVKKLNLFLFHEIHSNKTTTFRYCITPSKYIPLIHY